MRKFRLLFIMTFAVVSAMAQGSQVDFNNPAFAKWGATPEEREQNMFASTFMREALDNKNYNIAAGYFQQLLANCPEASEAVFARAVNLYKAKIARAASLPEKREMIDSLMIVHDLRLQYFSNHQTRGAAYITDSKARDFFNYSKSDREGLREVFKAAIEAGGANVDLALVLLYFQNLCDDYATDDVMADEVISEYARLSPLFDNVTGDQVEMKSQYDNAFGNSGVASCENLEAIFKSKIAATPTDGKLLEQAVRLMDRAGCKTPFYAEVAEKYYVLSPTSQAAMVLATIFQNDGDYDKAVKYLRDALAEEADLEEQENLYSRIALIELAAGRMSEAMTAAVAALAVDDGTSSDNGVALFVIAQGYGAAAEKCPDLQGQIAYLAAYDAMQRALANFSADEASYKAPAAAMAAQYKAFFPTKEECFFNEIEIGSKVTVECGIAKGLTTIVRTRD